MIGQDDPTTNQRHFTSVVPDSALAREGAVYALRMIEGMRWHPRLWERNRIRDREVLRLVGLEQDEDLDGAPSLDQFRGATADQLRRLEPMLRVSTDMLARNVDTLGARLNLDATERAVLRLAVIATRVPYFSDLFSLVVVTDFDLLRAVTHAIRSNMQRVCKALSGTRTLRRSGFFETDRLSFGTRNPLELDDNVTDALLSRRFDVDRLLRGLVRPAPPASLAITDFGCLSDLDLIQRYLRDTLGRNRKGANILLHGAPGTGKTEFVRALASSLGAALHEVPNQDANGEPISGRGRFNAYTICQNILSSQRRQLLLFDEVEDVFGAGNEILGSLLARIHSRDPDRLRKSWVNEILESNPVPAIWVSNSIDAIDPAHLRRFDLVVEFRAPSRAMRRRLVERYFADRISPACAEKLAGIEQLPPAQFERIARVTRLLGTRESATRDAETERLVAASLRAMGLRRPIPAPALPAHYDPAFLNTDRDLDAVARGLRTSGGARLCLYGPPGTGKTAFAHHLGRELDRPVLVRRASDLMSKWVGETERLTAEAFAQAVADEAILVIDEADGFLRDRNGAQRNWEVTQVNELLTQMEAFEGIFVASTNLIDTLDAAALRRFDFKVKFGYLSREQRRAMLRRVVQDTAGQPGSLQCALEEIDRLDSLTPGDFANVLRQLRVSGEAPDAARLVALLASEMALKPEGRRRAIGFSTR